MKKRLFLVLIILLVGTFLFAATEETSRLTLSVSVTEGPENSGIRIISGDPMAAYSGTTSSQYNDFYKNVFENQALNDSIIDAGDSVMTADVNGLFTVMVRRTGGYNTITVNVSATPLRSEDGSANYIGYKINERGKSTAIINTLANPSASTSGASYVASPPTGSVGVRDARVFEYFIPKATNAMYGKYSATIFFAVTIE